MDKTDPINSKLKTHNCGCVSRKEGVAWILVERCPQHTPNLAKQAIKIERKNKKKPSRGFTKSNKKKR